jgi:hypothetical protein
MTHFYKAPAEKLDFQVDWTAFLEGDTIASSDWSVEDENEDITLSAPSFASSTADVWAEGGNIGYTYALTNTIVTAAGRTESRTLYLDIVERNT